MSRVLDITPLRSLVAIADSGGFRRAATDLSLTQSAVSNHVRRLEATVGEPLVERDGRGARFTPAGETLLRHARQIIGTHDQALEMFAPTSGALKITIGATEHATEEILPPIVAALKSAFPDVAVQFRFDRGRRLRESVRHDELDIAVFVTDGLGELDNGDAHVGEVPLHWCAAPGWVRPADPRSLPVVAIHSPCSIRNAGMKALTEHNIRMNVTAEAAYLAGVINAARAGIGVALLAYNDQPPRGLVERHDLPPVPPTSLYVRIRPGTDRDIAELVLGSLRSSFTRDAAEEPDRSVELPHAA